MFGRLAETERVFQIITDIAGLRAHSGKRSPVQPEFLDELNRLGLHAG
jgi:hypothetical protein